MKIKKSISAIHPEGWFPFKLIAEEASEGKFGTQIKWTCQSSQRSEEGPILLTYYTGTVLSSHEKCKLTNLFVSCGIIESADDVDEDDDLDSGIALGKVFEGRVDEAVGEKGTFSNIGAVRPVKPKKSKAEKVAKFADKEEDDPFAE